MNRARMPGAWWTARHTLWRLGWLRSMLGSARVPLASRALAFWSSRTLVREVGPAGPRSAGGVVTLACYRGEATLLAPFLAHHRGLGIDEYVFLDLSIAGDLAQRLEHEPDCVVWRPRGAWHPSHAAPWLNHLRHRYASGRWCLSLEASELFVYHRYETRPIRSLTDFLDTEHRDHVYALVLEMYGDRPAAELALAPGESPLARAPYFDPSGYVTQEPAADRSVAVLGGLRRRTLFADRPWRTPPLNRIPLVKWRPLYAYVEGTRLLRPNRLNTPHSPWHTSPTGCLLRLALLGPDTGEEDLPAHVASADLRRRMLRTDVSRRYTGSADLVGCGLLNPGQWF